MPSLEFAHGRSGFQPIVEIFQKAAMEVVDFPVDSCGGFWSQNTKENSAEKIRQPKTKIHWCTTPPRPKSTSQAQKSAAKPTNKSACQTSKCTLGFSIEKARSWTRLQSMDSGTVFGCLLGMVEAPMLKCT